MSDIMFWYYITFYIMFYDLLSPCKASKLKKKLFEIIFLTKYIWRSNDSYILY